MTGKRGLWRASRHQVVLRDVGCPEERLAFRNRVHRLWQLSPEACRQSRYRAAPTIRSRPQRSVVRSLIRDGSHANVLGPHPTLP
jgi:hypothetical protein